MATSFGTGTQITARALNTAFAELEAQIASASGGAPIGAVLMWSGTTANIPTGFAVANGASLSTTTYATLFGVIQYRYGGSGANFNLPDFTSRVPYGITGVPTVPATLTSNSAGAVDAHTHGVNSTFTAGNAASHTHANTFTAGSVNSTFSAGNANNHTHNVVGNTGTEGSHYHGYYKPNSGANNNTGAGTSHSHGVNIESAGSNTTISVNSSFTAGNVNSSFTAGGVNTAIGVNSSFTAGNASTINTSTPAHTHGIGTLEIIFIIRVA